MADEVSANADASKWTVRLKQGLEFHNGKTRDGRRRGLQLSSASSTRKPRRRLRQPVDAQGERHPQGRRPHRRVHADPAQRRLLRGPGLLHQLHRPGGFRPEEARSGPARSSSPASSRASRWSSPATPNYFGQVPWVDELTIIEFADTTARVNALLGGTVDAISDLPSAQIPVIKGEFGPPGAGLQDRRLAADHHAHRPEAVQRRARASGVQADPRPQGDDRAGLRRLRQPRQRHVRAVRPGLPEGLPQRVPRTSRRPSRC